MKFSYYSKLSKKNKVIYLKSESINFIELRKNLTIKKTLQGINRSLKDSDRLRIELLSQKLIDKICAALMLKTLKVKALNTRPINNYGELHGLYEPSFTRARPVLTIWIKTSRKKQPIRFKTFLRTLLHEFCHHYDYEHLGLTDSFHTIGFFNRESSLYKQLLEYCPPGSLVHL
jgi:hypothetical protein